MSESTKKHKMKTQNTDYTKHKKSTEQRIQIRQKYTMERKDDTNKYRELEERTFKFAEMCREFVKKLPRNIHNAEYGRQLIRSSGSQAANYIEANESLSRKDFIYRVRVCRKEAKESGMWLRLCDMEDSKALENERVSLFGEVLELRKIFNAIIERSIK